MMKKFIARIQQTITDNDLIKTGDTILIGISGGADSVALLNVLAELRSNSGLRLIACHVNHGLRKDADADQRFVEKICAQKNIPCRSIKIKIPSKLNDSIEQAARHKRFDALIQTAKKVKATSIALAHHQNDLAETVLMRIIRGTGLQGLQAILPKRTIKRTTFIRPLINEKRCDIEDFLSEHNIKFRTDPTNKNTKFLRNKIRHKLLNCLTTNYNPNIQETLANLAETTSSDYEYLRGEAAKKFKLIISQKSSTSISLNLKKLSKQHPAIKRLILRMTIEHLKGSTRTITLKHIQHIELLIIKKHTKTAQLSLPHGLKIKKAPSTISFYLDKN